MALVHSKPWFRIGARFALLLEGAAFISVRFFPDRYFQNFLDHAPLVCPLRILTGFRCAFCGITHAAFDLLGFNFSQAFRENLLSIPFFILLNLGLVLFSFGYTLQLTQKQKEGWGWSTALILFAYAILRNFVF